MSKEPVSTHVYINDTIFIYEDFLLKNEYRIVFFIIRFSQKLYRCKSNINKKLKA